MTHHEDTNGKLLTDEEVEKLKADVKKWMREPEQWRQLLTDRFNALLADRQARIEREKKVLEIAKSEDGLYTSESGPAEYSCYPNPHAAKLAAILSLLSA